MDNLGEDFREKLLQLPDRGIAYTTASIWKRGAALIIDILILNFLILTPFREVLTGFFENTGLSALNQSIPSHVYAALFFISMIALLYFTLLQYYQQQTLGMMVMKTYVLPKPGFWKTIARNLFILPFFPFNLLWIVEPAHLFFKGKRFLERLTGTNTVEVNHG